MKDFFNSLIKGIPKIRLNLVLLIIITLMGVVLFVTKAKYAKEKEKNEMLSGNALALTEKIDQFQVQYDQETKLNASKVHQLTLQLKDYKKMRSEDAILIKKLKENIKDLKSAATVTIVTRDTIPGDTVYIDKNEAIRAEYASKWIDISCKIEKGQNEAIFAYNKRDSLKLFKTIPYKRIFWGLIKWRSEKAATYKAISFDPKTTITGLEYIEIIE